jgi:DNA-binding response OmpR family regulator
MEVTMTYTERYSDTSDGDADGLALELFEREFLGCEFGRRPNLDPGSATAEDAHVLVVDDEPATAQLIGRVLERGGFWRVDTATGGRQALATMRARKPDVLVLDVYMPDIDGFAMLRALEAERRPRSVTSVLAISGDPNPQLRRSLLAQGADDFVARPCANDELVERVRALAQHSQSVNRALDRLSLLDGLLQTSAQRGPAHRRPAAPLHFAARPVDTPFLGGPRRGRTAP